MTVPLSVSSCLTSGVLVVYPRALAPLSGQVKAWTRHCGSVSSMVLRHCWRPGEEQQSTAPMGIFASIVARAHGTLLVPLTLLLPPGT